jgi:hypothetical protein
MFGGFPAAFPRTFLSVSACIAASGSYVRMWVISIRCMPWKHKRDWDVIQPGLTFVWRQRSMMHSIT